METLNFQTSRKTYQVNGNCEISFDPADIGFVNRLFNLMDKMEKQQVKQLDKPEDVFVTATQRDQEVRGEIDAVFGEPICEKVFGNTNVLSPAGGLPLYMNFLLAIIDEVDAASETETKTSARVNAYIQKYEKKYGKNVKR